ncbi:GNAT family N-acetyltransferase [Streptomyces sp. NPDC001792]|uniref:GNAT family N-acetyltransferase n=1 Tax=Streptomyces sp. NPDC001792 TaxID=3154524 RepID=UPI00332D9BEF
MSYALAALRLDNHPLLTLDGRATLTRPATTADRTAVNAMRARCSAESRHRRIAATHLLHTPADRTGELAILVEDAWQNLGLGRNLVRRALHEAHRLGMASVHVLTERDNHRMLSLCRSLGARVRDAEGCTVYLTPTVAEASS